MAGRELDVAKLRVGGGLSTRGACSRCPNVERKKVNYLSQDIDGVALLF